ncbi:MAG: hypothetical protein JKY42_08320, partial [Flavobacteriales bacterium]|nr:hypothetical protein [Flavobacteriales bacterium]
MKSKSISITIGIICSSLILDAQPNSYNQSIDEHRRELHLEFLDTAETPLTEEDLVVFDGLFY